MSEGKNLKIYKTKANIFAFLPTVVNSGKTVWFKKYVAVATIHNGIMGPYEVEVNRYTQHEYLVKQIRGDFDNEEAQWVDVDDDDFYNARSVNMARLFEQAFLRPKNRRKKNERKV